MGYEVNWTLHAPESFRPSADAEAADLCKKLKAKGYDVKLSKKEGVQWEDDGFVYDGYKWHRDRRDSDKYYYGELSIEADEMFRHLSKVYEGVFALDAVGEDGEMWRVYVKDGQSYTAQPTFPEFDESKLKVYR